ncbi:tetratricopeptide repeat protein [Dendronalium sp. ChiSLP03b]|nr:tetratricopeptide repeat protein [Dendronalium sp. ChiSLP03b]MDZ8207939.1 tetratricopeptide repeat protein [Dendronalium sp. ChiSLP03b]
MKFDYVLAPVLMGVSIYNQALKINPNYAKAYNNRGNARNDLGDKLRSNN